MPANGSKNLQPVQEGENGRNPTGKNGMRTSELVLAKSLSREWVELKLVELLQKDMDEIEAVLDDRKRQVFDHWIAKIITKGIQEGDYRRLDFIMDRLIGKVTEKKEISVPKPTIIRRRNGETVELGAEIIDTNTIDME